MSTGTDYCMLGALMAIHEREYKPTGAPKVPEPRMIDEITAEATLFTDGRSRSIEKIVELISEAYERGVADTEEY